MVLATWRGGIGWSLAALAAQHPDHVPRGRRRRPARVGARLGRGDDVRRALHRRRHGEPRRAARARRAPSDRFGWNLVLAVLLGTWASDIFAYFGGRLLGPPPPGARDLAQEDGRGVRDRPRGRHLHDLGHALPPGLHEPAGAARGRRASRSRRRSATSSSRSSSATSASRTPGTLLAGPRRRARPHRRAALRRAGRARDRRAARQGVRQPNVDRPTLRLMRNVALLGSTGSIGRQAIQVCDDDPGLRVCALAAGSDVDGVLREAERLGVRTIALADRGAPRSGRARASAGACWRAPAGVAQLARRERRGRRAQRRRRRGRARRDAGRARGRHRRRARQQGEPRRGRPARARGARARRRARCCRSTPSTRRCTSCSRARSPTRSRR